VVGWVRSVPLSGATGTNQDHLTVPNHRPVPPATLRPQVIRRVPDSRNPRGATSSWRRDQIQVWSDYRGVIPFLANHHSGHLHDKWSRWALALRRFLDPRKGCRSRPQLNMAIRFGHSIQKTAKPEKGVDESVDKWSTLIDAGRRKTNSSAVCCNEAVHSSCKRLSTAIAAFAVLLGVGRVTARELPSTARTPDLPSHELPVLAPARRSRSSRPSIEAVTMRPAGL